jgi:hypothetical protein
MAELRPGVLSAAVMMGRLLRGWAFRRPATTAAVRATVATARATVAVATASTAVAAAAALTAGGHSVVVAQSADSPPPAAAFVEGPVDVRFRRWLQSRGVELGGVRFGAAGAAGRGAFIAAGDGGGAAAPPSAELLAEEEERSGGARCWSSQTLMRLPPGLVLTAEWAQRELPGLRVLREATEAGAGGGLSAALGADAASDAVRTDR